MTGQEHYAEAERLIASARGGMGDNYDSGAGMHRLTEAQVHATLALAAATAAPRTTVKGWTDTETYISKGVW